MQFPDDVVVSTEAQDLIRKLCCEERNRLTIEQIKAHSFFKVCTTTLTPPHLHSHSRSLTRTQGVDWDHVRDGPGPYIPPIEFPEDIQNFPVEPSNKPAAQHHAGGDESRPSARKVVSSNLSPSLFVFYFSFSLFLFFFLFCFFLPVSFSLLSFPFFVPFPFLCSLSFPFRFSFLVLSAISSTQNSKRYSLHWVHLQEMGTQGRSLRAFAEGRGGQVIPSTLVFCFFFCFIQTTTTTIKERTSNTLKGFLIFF